MQPLTLNSCSDHGCSRTGAKSCELVLHRRTWWWHRLARLTTPIRHQERGQWVQAVVNLQYLYAISCQAISSSLKLIWQNCNISAAGASLIDSGCWTIYHRWQLAYNGVVFSFLCPISCISTPVEVPIFIWGYHCDVEYPATLVICRNIGMFRTILFRMILLKFHCAQ